jgi:glycosyltransferase involved in cell wall biosynthesis
MGYQLHWLCWQPTPYNDFLFRSLAADPEIDLTVHFREKVLASHPWQGELALGFKSRVYQRRLGLDWQLLRLAMHDERSFFVIGGWNEPTIFVLINLLITRRRPLTIWTDTPRTGPEGNRFKEAVRNLWLKWVFVHASWVLGTGRVALAALAKMGCPENKLINFPFVVDLEFFSPKPSGGSAIPGPLTFVSSGRLVNSLKGYDLALRALAEARDRLGGKAPDFKYRLAGTGADQENLEALVRRLGLAGQVEFVGWLETSALPEFYRSGQVLLHPAHYDPFPNAVLEAMACGLTVIGSDAAGSVVERIVHGHNGLIHRAGEVRDLADQIVFALENSDKIKEMAKNGRATAEDWPVRRAVATIEELLRKYCPQG